MRRSAPRIDAMRADDWGEVRRIFEEGIATGNATFETAAPGWESWDASHLAEPRLVAPAEPGAPAALPAAGRELSGWAALSRVSDRCVYAGVAEVSIYVAAVARGRGVGRTLLEALVAGSECAGIWTLQAGIFPENAASLELHRRCGFRDVGRREKFGRMRDGRWRDVILLERRSAIIGIS